MNVKKALLLRMITMGSQTMGTGCPERVWSLHPWRSSTPNTGGRILWCQTLLWVGGDPRWCPEVLSILSCDLVLLFFKTPFHASTVLFSPETYLNLHLPSLSRAGLSCQLQPAKVRFALREALVSDSFWGRRYFFSTLSALQDIKIYCKLNASHACLNIWMTEQNILPEPCCTPFLL